MIELHDLISLYPPMILFILVSFLFLFLCKRNFLFFVDPARSSKRINSTTTFMALNANNEPTTNYVHHRVHNSPLNLATTPPRRSWSTFTFNNKNFPDGKLSYESQQMGGDKNPWKINDVTEMVRSRDGKERQDVMARASQIVM